MNVLVLLESTRIDWMCLDSNNIEIFLWELLCAGFRHCASLHARVVLDGVAYRLSDLGDVQDVVG